MKKDKSVCEKTISGKHIWGPSYSACRACGMVDDRDLEAEVRKDEQANKE